MDDEYEFRALRPQGAEPVRCVLPSRFVLASFQAPSESRSCALIVGRNWSTSSWRAESVLEAFANAVTIVPNRTAPDKSATGTSRWIHPPGSICSLRRRRPQPRRGCGAQPEALARLQQHHPEHKSLTASESIQLADAQLVIARENGFPSWIKFKEYLLFRNAVKALDSGDLPRLQALLDEHPSLVRYQCHSGAPYEAGYFKGATLLHHVAGNPDRGPLPGNILDITRLLVSRGFDPKAAEYTIELLLTSKRASEAGVALPLIDLLAIAGAKFDLTTPDILGLPLLNLAPGTAEELVRRGAKMDIRHAAALGNLEARGVPDPFPPACSRRARGNAASFLWRPSSFSSCRNCSE